MNSLGPKLQELEEGQPVMVRYEPNQDGTNDVVRLEEPKPVEAAEVVLEIRTEE
jgi:hypothetical protein